MRPEEESLFKRRLPPGVRLVTFGAAWGYMLGVLAAAYVVWTFGLPVGARPAEAMRTRSGPTVANSSRSSTEDAAPPPSAGDSTSEATPAAIPLKGLAVPALMIPVAGVQARDLTPQFADPRADGAHEALDIRAPLGTPVKAAAAGYIRRLFLSKAGGNTIYQFDPSEQYCYYYAHLDRYADGLRENDQVRGGQVIGYVGTSGNAPKDTPHLHFAVYRLTPEKRWWDAIPIDPYPLLR